MKYTVADNTGNNSNTYKNARQKTTNKLAEHLHMRHRSLQGLDRVKQGIALTWPWAHPARASSHKIWPKGRKFENEEEDKM